MMRRDLLLVGLLLAATTAVAAWLVIGDYRSRQAPPLEARVEAPPMHAPATSPAEAKPAWSQRVSETKPKIIAPPTSQTRSPTPRSAAPERPRPAYVRPQQPTAPVTREAAREALAYVGSDPAAEEVWNRAINDPNMPANVRKDLIEDLNEDGFPDPRRITPDDLPLIVSRLALIERLGPDSMDDTNFAAFQEAYKDLVNMYNRVSGQQ